MDKIPKILFLSRGSASRAQIAEGFLRDMAGDRLVAFSAGTESAEVSPLALEVMWEAGVDISTQRPREIPSLFRETIRYAVVVCDEPRERYPVFPFTPKLLKWSVSDPESAAGGQEAKKQAFREVRDQLKRRVEELVETVSQPNGAGAKVHAAAA